MARPHRHTVYRRGVIGAGVLFLVAGALLLGLFVAAAREKGFVLHPELDLILSAVGWGAALELLYVLVRTPAAWSREAMSLPGEAWMLLAGAVSWLAGWALVASGIRRTPEQAEPASPAVGAPLHPGLARYVDFYWGTLAAYGGGILAAEVALILVHTGLAGAIGVPPGLALAVALLTGFGVAFGAGFWGSANARRLSVPEATIGLVYLGLPIPVLLTLRHYVPELQIRFGTLLREITYVAELIGRPEISYWLVFAGLVLMLVFGITSGFVATGSGRADVRTGFELFIARRHVMVFRPRLLLGALAILLLGIIPPLLVLAIIRATEAAVERTRIKRLGLQDPLRASEALDAAKLNEQTPTAMMTALSVGGVGVGVMALIIVLSVMSGFEVDLQKKILGTNAHGVVLKYGDDTFTEYPEVMEKIHRVPDVVGMTPFILNEVMISSEGNIAGSLIKGIDPATVGDVTDLPQNILPGGSLAYLENPDKILEQSMGSRLGAPDEQSGEERRGSAGGGGSGRDDALMDDDIVRMPSPSAPGRGPVLPGIILGKELASSLKVVVGDRVNVVSPLGGELGPSGPTPKSRPFRVAGVFYSGMYEYDSKFVYIALDEAMSFFGMEGVTGIELKLRDLDDARRAMREVLRVLEGYPYRTRDWGEMNKNLFSALRLEKLVMGIILSIIVIVAAGLIVATVIMLVLEKRKEIAVLKALGVPDGGIVKIFLAEGLQIGIAGGVLGLVAGLAWCLFIERVGIKLDPEVYYIPSLPVKIEALQSAIPVIIAVLVTYLASIYPALKASRVEPVEGLKAE
jgi:lipoprotein-releasing system permease protein